MLERFAVVVAAMLLSSPLTGQGPAEPWFCRVESASMTAGESAIGVSRQPAMERADPNRMYFIDILFFFTDGFEDDFALFGSSMHHEIWQSVSLLNAALANSGVNATFRVVGVEQLPGMPDDQDVAHRMIVEDDRARQRRNALGADLVYALVDDRSGVAGVACLPGSEAEFYAESCFYGSVNNFLNPLAWRTILRHEVGRNLGIQHSPESGGDPKGGFREGAVGYSTGSFVNIPQEPLGGCAGLLLLL